MISPSKERQRAKFLARQYGQGAARALTVLARTANELGLSNDELLLLLREFRDQAWNQVNADDLDEPFIDRAMNAALLKLSEKERAAAG